MSNSSHDYSGGSPSRALRKQSKLGPGIIDARLLEELLATARGGAEADSPRICDRCGREINPWPLPRGARCSPREWAMCIRNDPWQDEGGEG